MIKTLEDRDYNYYTIGVNWLYFWILVSRWLRRFDTTVFADRLPKLSESVCTLLQLQLVIQALAPNHKQVW